MLHSTSPSMIETLYSFPILCPYVADAVEGRRILTRPVRELGAPHVGRVRAVAVELPELEAARGDGGLDVGRGCGRGPAAVLAAEERALVGLARAPRRARVVEDLRAAVPPTHERPKERTPARAAQERSSAAATVVQRSSLTMPLSSVVNVHVPGSPRGTHR